MKKRIFISITAIAVFAIFAAARYEKSTYKTVSDEQDKVCCIENVDDCQLVIHVPFKIKPEHVEGFIKAINKCAAATMKEEGCLDYSIYQSPNDKTLFFLNEGWANKPAHRAHMTTAHVKTYFEEIKGMQDTDPNRKFEEYKVCPKLNAKK